MNQEQFEFDLVPSRDIRPSDRPVRLKPGVWSKLRASALRHSVDVESVGVVTIENGRRLAKALKDALASREFSDDVVPFVRQVEALLSQGRGMIVQRRSASAGTALSRNNQQTVANQPVPKLRDEFELFRLDKSKPVR